MSLNNEGPKSSGGVHTRKIKRSKKTGQLEESGSISSTEMYADDRRRSAETGDGTFSGSAAPRVGGVKVQKSAPVKGGTKSQVQSSKRKIKRSSMSSKQKKSALKALDN